MGILEDALGTDPVSGLARTAELLRDDADALDAIAERARCEHVQVESDRASCEATALEAPRAVRTRVIRQCAWRWLRSWGPGRRACVDGRAPRHPLAWTGANPVAGWGVGRTTMWKAVHPPPLDPGVVVRPRRHRKRPCPRPADRGADPRRIQQVAEEIERDYDGADLLLVGVLKGAVMIMADLASGP
jgi:hypothetical protein